MSKIRILYISHSSHISGAEMSLLALLQYLDRNAFEPFVIFPEPGPLKERVEALGIKTFICPLEWWIRGSQNIGFEGTEISARVHSIANIMNRIKPHLVHTNTSVLLEGALAAKLTGIQHIWHLHEHLIEHPDLTTLLSISSVYQVMDWLSNRIVTISDTLRKQLLSFIPAEKLVTIRNGVDSDRFKEPLDGDCLRDELGVPADAILIVSIGALVKVKGHDSLLEAASLVKRKRRDIRFLIVGPGSPEAADTLLEQIHNLNLDDMVYYLGFREDIPQILHNCDFVVHPSIIEGFPIVPLEAMAAGKPVVATSLGGVAEELLGRNGECGFIVPVNDAESLCKRILEISQDKTKREEMGKRAQDRFNEMFKAEGFARRFEILYKEILDNKVSEVSSRDERLLFDIFMNAYQYITETIWQVVQHKKERDHLINSRSWKITAPLRWLHRKLIGKR